MSLYTKGEKIKSLWHPITDEDFDIDFSKPFIVCCEDASLFIVKDLADMFYYLDEDRFYDVKAQALSEEGKEAFREFYFGYMYLDEEFYQAIEWAEGKYLEDVKGNRERPDLFVMTKTGPRVFDHFDFEQDGSPLGHLTSGLSKDFAQKYPESYLVDYVINLNHVPATSLNALFMASTDEHPKIYAVYEGGYDSDVEAVFTDKKKAETFCDKEPEYFIKEFDANDDELVNQQYWYKVKFSLLPNSDSVDVDVIDGEPDRGDKCFNAVHYSEFKNGIRCFYITVKANGMKEAETLAQERYHELLATEQTNFPLLRGMQLQPKGALTVLSQTSLIFDYFSHKACVDEEENIQDLFMKVKPLLPKPFTEEEEDLIDWQNLTPEYCLELMKEHGLDIEVRKILMA